MAVCLAMARAPGLIRFASRYTACLEDAEDAYQRAMELALTRAPATDAATFTSWLHTVIRREATLITERRNREAPASHEELDEAGSAAPAWTSPERVLEWRDRYHAARDALHGLTESQRVCVMLQSAGASHAEIGSVTGYSERTVHRAIVEGRARLNAWELRMSAGLECERIVELIDRTVDGSSSRRERWALSRHIRHCPSCRSRLRSRREQTRLFGSLVPPALVGAQLIDARPPDPGFALQWWERVTAAAGARAVQAAQTLVDIPAMATSKAGAAIAAVAAGAIGAPIVIGSVHSGAPPPAPTVAVATPADQVPNATSAAPARPPAAPPRRLKARPAPTTSPATRLRAARVVTAARTATAPQQPATATARLRGAAAVEFAP